MWLKAGLGIAALAVGRTKGTYLAAQYHRLRPRRGEKRTIVAVAHSMLVSAYHMLANDVPYQDLGPDYITRLGEERHRRRLLAQLGALGYDVTLERRQTALATLARASKIMAPTSYLPGRSTDCPTRRKLTEP
ncbi:hypothetical protein [Streptomyces sp. NPDC001507]|uniref:hypothetical protein n=1 Tax=Streptomyces sp. NPDC001507 TaxID=3364579 RepID=UPI0036B974C4